MKKKKPTKKVTAPVTYDPGKGRPKEYLAYLNYQEMEALKRLNGEGPYKGPKGIPSFVLGGATTSGTAANRAMSSAAQSNKASASKSSGSSSVSRISGGTAGSNAARASSSGGASGSGFSGIGSGGGGGRDSGQAANRPTNQGSSSVSRISGGTAGSNASRFASSSGSGSPSASVSRISGGVVGGNARDAQVRSAAASSDANRALQTPALRQDAVRPASVPAAKTPMSTQGSSYRSPLEARVDNRMRINDAILSSGALKGQVPSVPEIRAKNEMRLNAAQMAAQYSQYRSPPRGYAAAPQGEFGPRAGAGTGYLRTAETPGMINTGMPSALSGMPGPRGSAEATLRAYEQEKRIAATKPIRDRIPASKFYEDRVPSEPRLTAGRSAVVPSYPVSPSVRSLVATDPRVSLTPGAYAGMKMDDPRLTAGRSLVDPRRSPVLLRSYEGSFGPELMGAAGSELERNLLAEDEMARRDFLGEYERNLERLRSPSVSRTRGLETPEKILEVEDYFTVPSRDPADVSDEMVPGFGVDVNNIPRVQVTFDPTTNRPRTSSGYSGYGTFNVPDVVSPVIEGAPGGGKIFRDRVTGSIMSDDPFNPSVVSSANGNTVAYMRTDAIAPPPDVRSGVRALDAINDLRRTGAGTYTESYDVPAEEAVRRVRTPRTTLPKDPFNVDWGSFRSDIQGQIMEGYRSLSGKELPSSGSPPSQEGALPSQDSTITEEAEAEQEKNRKKAEAARRIAQGGLNLVAPGLGTLAGQGFKYLNASTQKLVDAYQSAGMTERKAMEEKYPNLIAHGKSMGLQTYYGMDKYNQWARDAGLRSPTDSGSGRNFDLPTGGRNDNPGSGTDGSSSGGTGGGSGSGSGGQRPYIYYEWDLGVNIPSPGQPLYTMYVTYLAEREAAAQAMYG